MAWELVKRGKVKDFYIHPDHLPTDTMFGIGCQHWPDDRYSLFDYGTFPQEIPGKADAMHGETVHFFRLLEREGIPTHFIEDMGDRRMMVRAARIPPGYGWIKPGETTIYLVPIEVVFSQYVTPVASLHGRLRSGREDPKKFGLERPPERGETIVLAEPRITLSTKIDAVDMYETELGIDLAGRAGLVGNERQELEELGLAVYDAIKRDAEDIGLVIADGKIETIMGPERMLYVADSCYTWDENRILCMLPDGRFVDLSKQFPRNIYTIIGYKEILKQAQKEGRPREEWPAPQLLDERQLALVAKSNAAVRKAILREKEGPGLEETAKEVADELDRLKDAHKRDETGKTV
jgi:phosphoribosylaminoimidazole-succinocarboxamide synthase